ncbi:MAG: PIN domain-containing protein [Rhizobiaceae bacterium]|nr:PIN domain-containing protein [Rhizobiaceae bacterium]MCV0408548.1 PIN domain-containing protein [Rhizobiaceae bacterium]
MSGGKVFVDTNIVFYGRDVADDPRVKKAQHWLTELASRQVLVTNVQVLNELANALFRKRQNLSTDDVFQAVDDFMSFGSTPVTRGTADLARRIKRTNGYSWWDCLLLASALELGCTHFLSEDLQDGQRIEAGGKALTIVSPFAHTPQDILSRQD